MKMRKMAKSIAGMFEHFCFFFPPDSDGVSLYLSFVGRDEI